MDTRRAIRSRRSARPTPRFADPWAFRDSRGAEPIAGLNGRPVFTAWCRRNGHVSLQMPARLSDEPPATAQATLTERSMLLELRRRVAATIARYRLAGWCTRIEIATIDALWSEGISLRRLARRDQVSAAAIGARIEGLQRKAPEFYRWWRLKQRSRQRRSE